MYGQKYKMVWTNCWSTTGLYKRMFQTGYLVSKPDLRNEFKPRYEDRTSCYRFPWFSTQFWRIASNYATTVYSQIINPAVINPLKPNGHYMYHQGNITKFHVLPTQCICVFCMDLRINSINQSVRTSKTQTVCVYCAVRMESLNSIQVKFGPWRFNCLIINGCTYPATGRFVK